jgi:uncharacterized protein (TIGR02147 family)
MSIFEFKDYRTYLRSYIRHLPRKGRGELSKIAKHLRINTTLLSQIMSSGREFSPEQALSLSEYLAHTEIETDYFALLVQHQRAGNSRLKKYLEKKLELMREEALKLSKRISHEKKLSDHERAIFYSSWIFSAIHLFTSTSQKGVTLDEIVARFSLPRNKAVDVMQFLLSSGLCIEKSGHYSMGVQSTFVERGSPYLLKHHSNWRLKAIQKSENLTERELQYSGQFSLSHRDFEALREKLADFLKTANELVKDSPAEEIASLNIDWFWIDK